MARLVPVKCPNCGAGLRIDPDRDFVTCSYCNTSAFVRTQTRPVTQQIAQQYPLVIDLPPAPNARWLIVGAVALMVVMGGATAIAVQSQARRTASKIAAPEPLDRDVPVTYTPALGELEKAAEPGREMWGDSRAEPAPTAEKTARGRADSESAGAAGPIQNARVREGSLTVSGRIPASAISGIVRMNFARFRMCYEKGLARTPGLHGRVTVRFVIGRDGAVSNVSNAGSDLGDASVANCVISAFHGLSFPAPPAGIVTVSYPLLFSRG